MADRRFHAILAWGVVLALLGGCSGRSLPPEDAAVDLAQEAGPKDTAGGMDTAPMGDGAMCTMDEQCDDGRYCNGVERCVAGRCQPGTEACNDNHSCTRDSCDEATRTCTRVADNSMCGDRNACNGVEVCDPGAPGAVSATGCTPVRPDNQIDCDDRNTCTLDNCDVAVGCVHSPRDLDGDGYVDRACTLDGTPTGMPGTDCNDSDPRVFPGATEVCDDGRDNNCNGLVDYADVTVCRPANGSCMAATEIAAGGVGTYTVNGSTTGLPSTMVSCGVAGRPTAIFRFRLASPQSVALSTDDAGSGTPGSIALAGACPVMTEERCARGATGFPATAPSMQLRMLAAGTWYVLVQRTTPGSFRLRLTVGMPTTPPALDLCPAAGSTSPFDLNDGMPHTVSFAGFFGDYSVSCETGAPSPDAVLPLTLTGTRNVTITASPMAGMTGERIVIALQRAPCGVSTSEVPRGCAQVTFFTTPARLVLRGLEAGSYFLVVKQQTGRDVTVQATLTDPGMRIPGDTCPGQDITPDTAPVTVTPTRFDAYADVGTTCGSSTRPEGWTDWVLHFRLTMPRDVTVTATNTGGATTLRMQLQSACMMGAPSAAVGPCVAGAAAVTRRYRGLAAGDYYIVLEGNPAPAGVQVAVTTTAPGVRLPGDSCPGVDVMPDGAPGTLSMSGGFDTTSDYGTACGSTRPLDNWTDWVFHFRLAVPRDVTLTMVGGGTVTRMQLQATCGAGATPIGGCVAATGGTATRRYRGLMAGDYYVVGETSGAVAPAGPIQLIVTTSDPGMRLPGDTCTSPVAVRPDGPPVVIPVAAFDNTPDHGTPCGSGTTPGAIWTDWVASYTLTEERDVLITTTNPSGAQMFQVLEGMCGVGTSALGACTASPPFGGAGITQRFSRQRPGTYFVVGETRASPVPANVTVTVSTMAPGSRPTYTQSVTPAGVPYVSACTAPGAMRFFPSVDDDAALVPLPFAFRFWGAPAAPMVNVTSNGWIGLNGIRDATYSNVPIPNASTPNAMVAALWDDLITGPEGVCVVTTGAMPDRHFVVEWPNVRYLSGGGPFTFEIILNETGSTIDMLYQTVTPPLMDSTVGVENQDGTDAVAVCGGAPCAAVTSGTRLRFSPSPAP